MLNILVLGGTDEARRLAAALAGRDGIHLVSSLAGRVRNPKLPVGEVHEGGFGGPEGLAAWLAERRIDVVVDATHPFAARMTASAVEATAGAGVPLLILRRPGWQQGPGDDWRWVPLATLPSLAVSFKRTLYAGLAAEFAPLAASLAAENSEAGASASSQPAKAD